MNSDLAPRASRLVAHLTQRERLVVMLRYAEELSVAETAAVLGLAAEEVRTTERTVIRVIQDRLRTRPK